jgi:hypothetical protein
LEDEIRMRIIRHEVFERYLEEWDKVRRDKHTFFIINIVDFKYF